MKTAFGAAAGLREGHSVPASAQLRQAVSQANQ